MTCPHCQARLLGKERVGGTCARCGRAFALDPKADGRGMNDLRIQRRARQLTQDGRLQVTLTQFWYLSRTGNPYLAATAPRGKRHRSAWPCALLLSAALVVTASLLPAPRGAKWWVTAMLCLFLCGWASERQSSYLPARPAWARVEPSYAAFRAMMCDRWTRVYGALPPGIVDDQTYVDQAAPPERPRAALLCSDRAVVVFLAVNGLLREWGLVVAGTVDDLPAGVPVVVLHDASARGTVLALETRAALPGRVVVDAGLSADTARARQLVRLVDGPSTIDAERLRTAAGLPLTIADWLAEGWWCPLASVPPARLETVVGHAVRQAVERDRLAGDPRHRRLSQAGFLTWPTPPETTPTEGGAPR
ncbi:hypothetical protein [Streptomyces sp. NPDC057702]|uniref:hypothetical protein n=1 Tax=unclassified Streptomyces TaxID=2593676 RepID=UPI0036C35A65